MYYDLWKYLIYIVYIKLFSCLPICGYLTTNLPVRLSAILLVHPSVHPSVRLSVNPSVHLSVYLFIYLTVYVVSTICEHLIKTFTFQKLEYNVIREVLPGQESRSKTSTYFQVSRRKLLFIFCIDKIHKWETCRDVYMTFQEYSLYVKNNECVSRMLPPQTVVPDKSQS